MRGLKRFLCAIILTVLTTTLSNSETITLKWLNNDGSAVSSTTTCESGGDVILPATPTKYGYTFQGWKLKQITPVEYLESTGTQRIVINNVSSVNFEDVKMFVKWEQNGTPINNYAGVALLYHNEQTNTYRILANEKNTGIYYVNGNSVAGGGGAIINAAMNTIHEGLMQNGSVVIDGAIYTTSYKGNALTSDNTFVMLNGFVGRIYKFWLSIDGVLRYDFIPVLDYIGIPCMYDKVSGQFFYNQGTGDFIAGPVISE